MLNRFLSSAFALLFFTVPAAVSATVVISEIMYDVEGSDSGREWIELHNNGSEPIDTVGWKLFENGVNHRMTSIDGSLIPAGGYAVIVSNTEKFLADWPHFAGVLLKSSFSLSNAGESFALKDASGSVLVSFSYEAPEEGGGGNSLNLVDGSWSLRRPSPHMIASADRISPPAKAKTSKRNVLSSGGVQGSDSAEPSAGQLGVVSNIHVTAAAQAANQSSGILPWIIALVSVMGIAGVAIFFGKRKNTKSGYTIIEDHS